MTEEQKCNDNEPVRPEVDDEINLLELVLVLVKNKYLILGTVAVTFVLTCIVTLLMPNVFTATARLIPPQQDKGRLAGMMSGAGGMAALVGLSPGADTAEYYVGMLQSRAVADVIIERFDLMSRFEWESRDGAYRALRNKVSASVDRNNGFITVQVDDEDPRFAAELANAYVEELQQLHARINLNTVGRERVFLEERLAMVQRDLVRAEDTLRDFQQSNKAIQIDAQAMAVIDSMSRLKGQITAREVELGVLLTSHTEQNPQVRALREGIAQLRAQLRNLQGSSPGARQSADIFITTAEVPDLGLQYARLLREFKVQETLYELLTNQYEVAKINEAKDSWPLQVLDRAYPPDEKSKPRRSRIVLLATFAAGMLAVMGAFVREMLDKADQELCREIKAAASIKLRKSS